MAEVRRSNRNQVRKDYKLLSQGKEQKSGIGNVRENESETNPEHLPVLPSQSSSDSPELTRASASPSPLSPPPGESPPSPSASPSTSLPPSPPSREKLTVEQQLALVRRLYLDPKFVGSFSGIKIMQREIFLTQHQHIPLNIVAQALRSIPMYLMEMKPIRKYPVAKFDVFTRGEVVQGKENSTNKG